MGHAGVRLTVYPSHKLFAIIQINHHFIGYMKPWKLIDKAKISNNSEEI